MESPRSKCPLTSFYRKPAVSGLKQQLEIQGREKSGACWSSNTYGAVMHSVFSGWLKRIFLLLMTFFKPTCKWLYRFRNELASEMDDEMAGERQANWMLVMARTVTVFTRKKARFLLGNCYSRVSFFRVTGLHFLLKGIKVVGSAVSYTMWH